MPLRLLADVTAASLSTYELPRDHSQVDEEARTICPACGRTPLVLLVFADGEPVRARVGCTCRSTTFSIDACKEPNEPKPTGTDVRWTRH